METLSADVLERRGHGTEDRVVPATGTRPVHARMRSLRLIGLALALVFLCSLGTAAVSPVEAKDWTPQIQATRRAQVYWESIMRAADAELRGLKKAKRQAQRKLRRIEAKRETQARKRASAKRRLKAIRVDLAAAREPLEVVAIEVEPPGPPDPSAALEVLLTPATTGLTVPPTALAATALAPDRGIALGADVESADSGEVVDQRAVAKLAREAKRAKRDFRQAQRKAKRAARNARAVKARVRAVKTAESGAFARRERAERSLGTWILAMTKYGRIRATKKSKARPGVNSAFAWPVNGRISQYYHAGHDGLDIVRYRGAPVRAAAFGVVTYVGWNPWDQHGRAFMVVVTHAGGYETLYGHLLPRRVVRVGEEVKKGTVIGYLGSTGNSSGPHLHLELRRGRTTINPLGFL
jgi:murein DD-endopeptidase MepM/ murein hydrolase activator NlpD